MSTRMSARPRAGITPATLVIVIIVAIIAGTIAFVMYTDKVKAEADLEELKVQREAADKESEKIFAQENKLKKFVQTEGEADKVGGWFEKDRMKDFKADPKDFRTVISKLELQLEMAKILRREVEARIAKAEKDAEKTEQEREAVVTEYRELVARKNSVFTRVKQELTDLNSAKQTVLDGVRKKETTERTRYEEGLTKWELQKEELLSTTERARRRNDVVRRAIKVLRPEPIIAAPAGRIVRSDWRTHCVVIDLGKRDVFPGLGFEVYFIDDHGRQVVKGKIEVFKTFGSSSMANILRFDPKNPIVAGDAIRSPYWPVIGRKKFVIAGFIPPEAVYTEQQLKTLIKLNGGEVQRAVDLNTDVLILGQTTLTGIGDMAEDVIPVAEKRIQGGLAEEERARELGHEIVDWEEFLASIRR